MTTSDFWQIYEALQQRGYTDEIDWSENLKLCNSADVFLSEYIWVIVNSGMKNQIARKIFERITTAIKSGVPINTVFGHKGKVKAICTVMSKTKQYFAEYQQAKDKLEYLITLPWIGPITKYHLAKNLGHDCVKPDRHLVRIARQHNTTCQELCQRLAKETGLRIATIDVVLWRAANLRMI